MVVKPLDFLVVAAVLAVIAVFAVSAYTRPADPTEVVVESPEGKWVFSLAEEGTFVVPGAIGEMEIEIHDHSVRVLSSPCREKICIHTGAVSRSGAWIACMPNRVFIRVEGGTESEIDALSF